MIVVSAFGACAPLVAAPPTPLAARGSGVRVVPYEPAHLRRLIVKGKQAHLGVLVEDDSYAINLARGGPNYTAVDGQDRVLCIAGVYEAWEGRAIAHAFLASTCRPHLGGIMRAIGSWLATAPYARIEAHVQTSRAECHRFARLLGFARECTMRRFLGGEDFDLYARIRARPVAPPPTNPARRPEEVLR